MNAEPAPRIPDDELHFATSRSSGPGGQNVNKVETRVTLMFDLEASSSLSDAQKRRLRERLATRINRQGVLRVTSQRHRTQKANREAAIERFHELVASALAERPRRARTRIPKAAKKRRLEQKRRRSELKKQRRPPSDV